MFSYSIALCIVFSLRTKLVTSRRLPYFL